MNVPVVDICALRSGTEAERLRIAGEIGDAARSIGFLSVAGHGIPAALLTDTFEQARAFFALPYALKERVASGGAYRGFTGAASLANGDLHESYDLGIESDADGADAFAGRPLVVRNRWPELAGFRSTMLACFHESFAIFEMMHRAVALDLGADPEFFTPLFGRNYGMRLSYYPPVTGPREGFGASAHTDFGNLTLLAEDAPGLELFDRHGVWLPVDASPAALVCNIGDCLTRWSNGSYRSTRHRVLNPTDRDRISIGFFANADLNVIVEPLQSCTGPDRPPAYEPIEFGTYMQERFSRGYIAPADETSGSGMREEAAVRQQT